MESNRCVVCSGDVKATRDYCQIGWPREGAGAVRVPLRYIKYRAKNPSMPGVYTAADALRLSFLGWMDMPRTDSTGLVSC